MKTTLGLEYDELGEDGGSNCWHIVNLSRAEVEVIAMALLHKGSHAGARELYVALARELHWDDEDNSPTPPTAK